MPLVLAVVVLLMNMPGMDLNRITLGTLIIALGLTTSERRDEQMVRMKSMIVELEGAVNRCSFSRHSTGRRHQMPLGGSALQTPIFCKT